MKRTLLPLAVLLSTVLNAQASIIPFGIQANVSTATVSSWGWTECSRTNAGASSSTSNIVSSCAGDYLAMGIWDASLGAYGVVGIGAFSAVTAITYFDWLGDDNSTVQNWSNGLNWYRTSSYGSWGFTTAAKTALGTADTNLQDGLNNLETTLAAGLSYHIGSGGELNYGWAYNPDGNHFTLINSDDQRVFWTATAQQQSVPEPATLGLLGLGFVGLGFARRRKS